MSNKSWDFWSDFRSGDGENEGWPAFTQAAVCAQLGKALSAAHEIAGEYDLDCTDVTESPEMWDGGVCFATADQLTLMTEPSVDLEERFVNAESAELLLERLEVSGAFFGYDPAAGTLMLSVFSNGNPVFLWSDSLQPGPSFAITFHDDGTATQEDPRKFALRRLGQPETSPFLDRYAFVEHELAKLGLSDVQPDLEQRPIIAVLQMEREPTRSLG